MIRTLSSRLFAALACLAAGSVVTAEPQVRPQPNGDYLVVVTLDCSVRFDHTSRILDKDERCLPTEIGSASKAMREYLRARDPAVPAGRSAGLHIDSVQYGTSQRRCDATPPFARQCNGQNNCRVEVGNELCGDPARGQEKFADIRYRCDGHSQTARVQEGHTAYLQCAGRTDRPAVVTPPRAADDIRIETAAYGSESRRCDARAALARQCNDRRECRVEIDNDLCGDPHPGTRKFADIEYRCGNRYFTVSVHEGETASLSCSSPTAGTRSDRWPRSTDIRVDRVAYGAGDRYCNATSTFARECNDRRHCEVEVDNEMCGDPAPGTRKAAEIDYSCGNRPRKLTVDERDVARLDCR